MFGTLLYAVLFGVGKHFVSECTHTRIETLERNPTSKFMGYLMIMNRWRWWGLVRINLAIAKKLFYSFYHYYQILICAIDFDSDGIQTYSSINLT